MALRTADNRILAQYERELVSVRDASDATVDTYGRELRHFAEWLNGRGTTLVRASRGDIVAYRETLGDRAAAGLCVVLAALRSFYEYAIDAGRLDASPVPIHMRVGVKRQEPKDVPTAAQFLAMRAKASDDTRPLLDMLAGTGLRISAFLSMKVCNARLNLDGKSYISVDAATMSCKGHIAGSVPVTPHAARVMDAWIKARGLVADDRIIRHGENTVRDAVIAVRTPELPGLVPHSLRHFYVSMLYWRNLDGGKFDVVWVRDAAGHSNIATTDTYLRLARTICAGDAEWEEWAYGR